jgi:thioredoxin reductase (NADPH)
VTELLVVGAGPAGVSAALRALELNLSVLLIEGAAKPGGQLHMMHFHPLDVPGFESGDGATLAASYARQLEATQVPVRIGARAERIEPATLPQPRSRTVVLEGGERLEAAAVLVATGLRRRRLGVPGERELEDRGVSFSANRDMAKLAGRRVAVIGGGDAAYENALVLAATGGEITLIVRGEPRARPEFRARVAAEPRIGVRTQSRVLEFAGAEALEGVRLASAAGEEMLATEHAVIKAGVVPNSEWCASELERDPDGYVRVDGHLATTAPRVWAAGDITRALPPSVPVAVGQGAQAVARVRAELRRA